MNRLLGEVRRRFSDVPEVVEAPSQFGHDEAWWLRGTEIAHLEPGEVVEIRVGRHVISEQRATLKAHPSVRLRKSTSDWLEVVVTSDDDLALAADLFDAAVTSTTGSSATPTDEDIQRRQRLHGR